MSIEGIRQHWIEWHTEPTDRYLVRDLESMPDSLVWIVCHKDSHYQNKWIYKEHNHEQ